MSSVLPKMWLWSGSGTHRRLNKDTKRCTEADRAWTKKTSWRSTILSGVRSYSSRGLIVQGVHFFAPDVHQSWLLLGNILHFCLFSFSGTSPLSC